MATGFLLVPQTRRLQLFTDGLRQFWKQFGLVLKEGPAEDSANIEAIAKLLRFASTHTDSSEQTVSLEEYISRMKEGQWGCPWSRRPDGSVNVRRFGGMKIERTWFAADKTGFHMLHTLFQTSLQFPQIQRFDAVALSSAC
jgi:hypothetical protein